MYVVFTGFQVSIQWGSLDTFVAVRADPSFLEQQQRERLAE